jgi:transcriptional regulator with XRE-family HTH domain
MPKRRVPRWRPQHLAAKLLAIRQHLGLSQSQLIECLDLDRVDLYLENARISEYEHGTREEGAVGTPVLLTEPYTAETLNLRVLPLKPKL